MAERTRFETSGDDWLGRLSAALRHEAQADRPAFSAALQERVLLALETRRGRHVPDTIPVPIRVQGGRHVARPAAWAGAVGVLAAVAVMTVGPRPEPPASVPMAVAAQGIEVLPTPEEIGTSVLTEMATLAAVAVGVPDLPDLATFDPSSFVVAADPRP